MTIKHCIYAVSPTRSQVDTEIFARHGDGVARAVMAGNSMRSDVVPVVEAGGHGVYVPHGLVWEVEHAEPPVDSPRYHEIEDLSALPDLIAQLG